DFSAGSFDVVGVSPGPGEQTPHAFQDLVLGGYFRAMQIPLVEGRLFNDGDTGTAPRVVIVDTFLAKRHFPDGRVLGKQLNFGSPRNYTIVGVVGTVVSQDLASPLTEGRIYFAESQLPTRTMWFAIKGASEPALLAPQVREAVRSIDPEQPISRVRSMDDWVGRSLQPRRAPAVLLTLFGAI